MNDYPSDHRLDAWVVEQAPKAAPSGLVARSMAEIRSHPRQASTRPWSSLRRLAVLPAVVAVVVAVLLGTSILLTNHAPVAGPGSSSPGPSLVGTSPVPPTASPLPISTDLAAGLPYYCGNGEIFQIDVLSGPANATEGTDPAAGPVRSPGLPFSLDATHWWLVYRTATQAEFLGQDPSGNFEYLETEFKSGTWVLKGLGDCQFQYLVRDRATIAWWIDPANPPKSADRELHVLGRDLCPPTLAGRLGGPVVRYGTDSILIVLTATASPVTGTACGSAPGAPVTVRLTEPIGARSLVDGGVWPARDARIVPPPLSGAGG
jgi:hypothetical protein